MENLPVYITSLFITALLATVFLLYKATNQSNRALLIALIWLAVQGIVGSTGFYQVTNTTPPRFALLLMPPLVMIAILFATAKGRNLINQFNPLWLTSIHIVRILVELVLHALYTHKHIPQIMTFEGRNFDILSGLTAPCVVYFGYNKQCTSRGWLITWNVVCLMLVVNIAVTAVLSAPFSFQKFGFEQPNVAILHFPFIWLPCFIVPVVVFAHVASIRALLRLASVTN